MGSMKVFQLITDVVPSGAVWCRRSSNPSLQVCLRPSTETRPPQSAMDLQTHAKRKMMCWGRARPRPGPRLPPLEGGGRQPCTGLLVVLPPVRKSPVRRACCACCRGAHMCRKDSGHGGGAGRAPMHVADAPAHGADVCHVRARLSDCRARCQRAPASLLCVGCRCDVQCGAMRVDALGAVLPVQVQ